MCETKKADQQKRRSPVPDPVPRLGMIADDLTGACDAAVAFAQRGFETVVVLNAGQAKAGELTVLSTASREDPPRKAARKVKQACEWLAQQRIQLVYKKIDSTLRGNLVAECQASIEATGFREAVVAPAFPAMGRTIVNGRLQVHGVEPSDPKDLRSIFAGLEPIKVRDARTEAELAEIVQAAFATDPAPLLVGSGGLSSEAACVLAGLFGKAAPAVHSPQLSNSVILFIGSSQPATKAQVDYLKANRPLVELSVDTLDGVVAEKTPKGHRHLLVHLPLGPAVEQRLARFFGTLDRSVARAMVLSGGDTAALVCRSCEADAIQLMGEVTRGIPWGRILGGFADGWAVVTKAGGFGADDALARVTDFMSGVEETNAP